MADRMMFITWGEPVRGREERSLEVFNEAVGLYGRMQQEGRIESFDVALLVPSTDLGGYIAVHGSPEQIAALREDEEYQRNILDAGMCVNDVRVCEGYTGAGVGRQMALYQDAIAKVPQMA
jgi:hypothetical protein